MAGVPSDLCCLQLFEVTRTSCFWTSGERYEFIMGASSETCIASGLPLHSSSQVCHCFGMNYSSFFIFLLRETLITESGIGPPAVTVGLYDGTLSKSTSSLSKTAFLFPLSHIVNTHSFLLMNFPLLPSRCLSLLSHVEVSHESHFQWISQLSRCGEGSACVSG